MEVFAETFCGKLLNMELPRKSLELHFRKPFQELDLAQIDRKTWRCETVEAILTVESQIRLFSQFPVVVTQKQVKLIHLISSELKQRFSRVPVGHHRPRLTPERRAS